MFVEVVVYVLLDDFKHDGGKAGIELGSGTLLEFALYYILGDEAAVASVAGHGVVGVGDGDDPGFLGDVLTGKAVGIASAVVAFVVPAGTNK